MFLHKLYKWFIKWTFKSIFLPVTSIEIGVDDSGHTTNAMRCNPAAGESSDCWLPFCQHEVGRLGALNTNSGRGMQAVCCSLTCITIKYWARGSSLPPSFLYLLQLIYSEITLWILVKVSVKVDRNWWTDGQTDCLANIDMKWKLVSSQCLFFWPREQGEL